jgi:ElaB/YqjD/DUF883 family membrane-anchored ribosome-binding protein
MTRRKKAARSGLESIQDQLETLSADVTSLGNTLGDVASVEAREMIKSIRQRVDRIANDAGSATRAGVGMIQDTIEDEPFISVAVAFGLGVVFASMLRIKCGPMSNSEHVLRAPSDCNVGRVSSLRSGDCARAVLNIHGES